MRKFHSFLQERPLTFGVLGIQMVQAVSDACTLLYAIHLQMDILRDISRET